MALLINGLGATSVEELYILSGSVTRLLQGERGVKLYRTHVGEYATKYGNGRRFHQPLQDCG